MSPLEIGGFKVTLPINSLICATPHPSRVKSPHVCQFVFSHTALFISDTILFLRSDGTISEISIGSLGDCIHSLIAPKYESDMLIEKLFI